jgi:transposase InsO family protein
MPLTATAPNQIYSWDITYLKTTIRGIFLYLYLFMDIYSRNIVGWQVYEHESSEWAADRVRDITRREGLTPEQVTLHWDNGGPMKGASMLAAMQALGIMPSFSRPAVSNDNPYSGIVIQNAEVPSGISCTAICRRDCSTPVGLGFC